LELVFARFAALISGVVMLGWMFRAVAAASTIALLGPTPASAATIAVGYAVKAVGNVTEVGLTENRPLLGNQEAIKYFIPLKDDPDGIYGKGSSCGGTGYGTCADTGNGGAILTMILRFSPVSMTEPSTLQVLFEDLDLAHANDPNGFLERIRVVKANGDALTPWITDINQILVNGDISGDADTQQLLQVQLGTLTADPLFLILKFKSQADFHGTNTAEFLRAIVTSPDPGNTHVVPLPSAFLLMGTLLAGVGGVAKWRRRRERAAA
jgi:hypothetical protein